MKKASFTQVQVTRALKGALAAGMPYPFVEIHPDGRLTVRPDSSFTPPTNNPPTDEALDHWLKSHYT